MEYFVAHPITVAHEAFLILEMPKSRCNDNKRNGTKQSNKTGLRA